MLISSYAYADAHGRVKNKQLSDGQRGVLRIWLLPYGVWDCGDGHEVLIDRDYRPIYERRPGQAARVAGRPERASSVELRHFYDDKTSLAHRLIRGRTVLVAWRMLDDFNRRLAAISDEELCEVGCTNMPRRFPGPIRMLGKR